MSSAIAASGNYLREHPDVVEGVLKALIEAQALLPRPLTAMGFSNPYRVT